MPELPEVETIVCGLKNAILDKKIEKVEVKEKKLISIPDKDSFIENTESNIIKDINRHGKYIVISLDNDKDLIIHLRMTGKLLLKNRDKGLDKHTYIIFQLSAGEEKIDLRFNNMRKFGRLYLVDDNNWEQAGNLSNLGPEPLSEEFTFNQFKNRFKNRSGVIKSLLLNQSFIAGIGNIYCDEILFEAGIHPERKADTLKKDELQKLYKAIKKVLKKGIEFCGTSIKDYVNEKGDKGSFQEKLKVYMREGDKCVICGHKIKKIKIGGRGTHFCSNCQV